MEAGYAAFDQGLGNVEIVFDTQIPPGLEVTAGQNSDDVEIRNALVKAGNGALQHRDSVQLNELLRRNSPHPGPAAASNENRINFSI